MKKEYTKVKIELVNFTNADIITVSLGEGDNDFDPYSSVDNSKNSVINGVN